MLRERHTEHVIHVGDLLTRFARRYTTPNLISGEHAAKHGIERPAGGGKAGRKQYTQGHARAVTSSASMRNHPEKSTTGLACNAFANCD